jgi:vacuolar-type H+-ATPase subunit E/Vma4
MAENTQQPQDVLREEILADARRQAERALQRARKEADGIAGTAKAELDAWRIAQLELARAEAQRHTDMILAGLPVEIGRLRANRTESLLQSIYEEACQRLVARDGLDYRQALVNLASEAIRGMAGSRFVITLPEVDRPLLGDGETEAIRQRVDRPELELELVGDPESRDTGLVVRGGDGGEFWDNRLFQRLERLWPALRREIAMRTALVEPLKSKKGERP